MSESPEVLCVDCARPYPHGLDLVLTKKQWLMIHPDDGGVLCPSCIVNRAAKLDGAISVYGHIELGEHYDFQGNVPERLILAIRLENADYCAANGDLRHTVEILSAALKKEFDRQNCTCKMLGYIGEEPPCGKCQIGEALSQASSLPEREK